MEFSRVGWGILGVAACLTASSFSADGTQRAALWIGAPLPQTNTVGNTTFILAARSQSRLSFRARSSSGPPAGWIHWRFEVEDSAGKRAEFGPHPAEIYPRIFAPGPLKVTVFSEEYLSAGFVMEPAAGEIVK